MNKNDLGEYLDRIYIKYRKKHSSIDPVWALHNFHSPEDAEIAGLLLSCYSYGKVEQINAFAAKLFTLTGPELRQFTLNYCERKDKKLFDGMKYRFNSQEDLSLLISNIKNALLKFGSLKAAFINQLPPGSLNTVYALNEFARLLRAKRSKDGSYDYLIPLAEKNSTCKRLNLYLRWMVRSDEIDLGLWKEVGAEKLIFPVDTHVYNVSRKLSLVNRKSCDLKFALELTDALKVYDPSDPVKYDFALCHIGIDGLI